MDDFFVIVWLITHDFVWTAFNYIANGGNNGWLNK
jgi:hypothetical protein